MSFPFRRKPDELKQKEKKYHLDGSVKKKRISSKDYQNIRNKLGLGKRTNDDKVKFILRRYAKKPRNWDSVGITKEDFKRFGIQV